MMWVVATIGELVCALALAAGLWAWRRRWLPRAVIYGSLLALTLWLALCERLGTRVDGLFVAELPVAAGLGVLLLCGLASVAPPRYLRRPLLTLPLLLWAAGGWSVVGPALLQAGWFGLDRSRDAAEVAQSTWWTCGPAALATFDRSRGGHLSEADAAVLCQTVPFCGTRMAGLVRALKVQGCRAQLHYGWSLAQLRPGDEGLAMVCVYGRVLHCLAVLGVSQAGYDVFDPSFGRRVLTRRELGAEWLGVWVGL